MYEAEGETGTKLQLNSTSLNAACSEIHFSLNCIIVVIILCLLGTDDLCHAQVVASNGCADHPNANQLSDQQRLAKIWSF